MARNPSSFYHASATIPVLITVTFSTPTGVDTHNRITNFTHDRVIGEMDFSPTMMGAGGGVPKAPC
jgi:hypothetical protein